MAKQVLQHDVYWSLRQQIIAWKRTPGQTLPEGRLASEFNVSRTPLREALRRLAEEGLVDYEPRKRARVAELNASVVRDVFLVREALEGVAAREAAARATVAAVQKFRYRYEGLRSKVATGDLTNVGDGIHDFIFETGGSERLRKGMGVIMGQVRWIQHVAEQSPERLLRSFREHEAILYSLESRDAAAAEGAARAHVRSVLAHIMEVTKYGVVSGTGSIAV